MRKRLWGRCSTLWKVCSGPTTASKLERSQQKRTLYRLGTHQRTGGRRMASFISRNGVFMPADEVFEAWTSGDLNRMLAARSISTHPIDRHHLLQGIVGLSYKSRAQSDMRALCYQTAFQHVAEFREIAPVLASDFGGRLPRVPTFATLAMLLTKDGRYPEAISVCEQAMAYGLHDGAKGDFPARIERIRKAEARAPKK